MVYIVYPLTDGDKRGVGGVPLGGCCYLSIWYALVVVMMVVVP